LLTWQSPLLQTFYLKSWHGEIERPILYSIKSVFNFFLNVFPDFSTIEVIVMNEENWEAVYETNGPLEAEILRGLLEANDIPVFLSQEGLGRVYGLTVGPLGIVQILVPKSKAQIARSLLQDYDAGSPPEKGDQDSADNSGEPDPGG
jgi:hypothetical protein